MWKKLQKMEDVTVDAKKGLPENPGVQRVQFRLFEDQPISLTVVNSETAGIASVLLSTTMVPSAT